MNFRRIHLSPDPFDGSSGDEETLSEEENDEEEIADDEEDKSGQDEKIVVGGKTFDSQKELDDWVAATDKRFGELGSEVDNLKKTNDEMKGVLEQHRQSVDDRKNQIAKRNLDEANSALAGMIKEGNVVGAIAQVLHPMLQQEIGSIRNELNINRAVGGLASISQEPLFNEFKTEILSEIKSHPDVYNDENAAKNAYMAVAARHIPELVEHAERVGAEKLVKAHKETGLGVTELGGDLSKINEVIKKRKKPATDQDIAEQIIKNMDIGEPKDPFLIE